MSILNLDKLDNLQELEHLRHLRDMGQLNRLEDLQRLEYLEQLENLGQLRELENLDNLPNLEQMDNLEQLQKLENLDQLQNMDLLNRLQNLEQLQKMDHLQQLELLQKLEELTRLRDLQTLNNLNHLESLGQLDKLQNLDELSRLRELEDLEQLSGLERLSVLDRAEGLDTTTALFFIASMVAPGFIYQEAFSIFGERRLKFQHAIVLMIFYNVLNMFLCIRFVYGYVTERLLDQNAFYFYAAWFIVLLLLPFTLGWLSAVLTNRCLLGESFKEIMYAKPAGTVPNAWERFLTESERYEMLVTLTNNEKVKGFFQKGMEIPETSDPSDLYLTETSRYDPQAAEWEKRHPRANMWVKGSEIKMVELLPQSPQVS